MSFKSIHQTPLQASDYFNYPSGSADLLRLQERLFYANGIISIHYFVNYNILYRSDSIKNSYQAATIEDRKT